jgi:hypothetical protein
MFHNRTNNKITPKSKKKIVFFENGSYAVHLFIFQRSHGLQNGWHEDCIISL